MSRIAVLAIATMVSAALAQGPSAPTPQPFTVTLETTYRPEITDSDSASYSPLPFTPDLGHIINSIASEPSMSKAMRQARASWDPEATHNEL
ncbi:hypothetical protein IWW42_001568 [Coemansia sp. RSA 1085]|nr:hypothetical protein IWW42_001568 [Coemansia sp. RSA 1085]